jgi:transcriptional regulator of arginine metabolism
VSADGNTYKYAESPKDDMKISVKYRNILKETLVSIDYACNSIVLKTYSAMAQAAAAAVDNMGWSEIVGSVAGDDCIILVSKSEEASIRIIDKIKSIANK